MKRILYVFTFLLMALSLNAQAFWGGNNNSFGGNGWGNNWPMWTPMYWMDEFSGNSNYNDYYGNANPWGGAQMNNMPLNTNPWSKASNKAAQFPPQGYSPYVGGGKYAGYPAGYPQGYRPLSGFQNMPLVPSRGPISFRP